LLTKPNHVIASLLSVTSLIPYNLKMKSWTKHTLFKNSINSFIQKLIMQCWRLLITPPNHFPSSFFLIIHYYQYVWSNFL